MRNDAPFSKLSSSTSFVSQSFYALGFGTSYFLSLTGCFRVLTGKLSFSFLVFLVGQSPGLIFTL